MYSGYVGFLLLKSVPNTITSTIVERIGSIRDHKIPRYERLYFSLIPFFTSSTSKNLYWRKIDVCLIFLDYNLICQMTQL